MKWGDISMTGARIARALRFPAFVFALAMAGGLVMTALPHAAQATGYLDSIEDMPLMEGLKETGEGGIAFDKPDGRIVRAVAEGRVADADVRRFYTQTLPQLGWTHARNIELINGLLVFRRENERLEIQIVPQKGKLTEVRFSIEPE